MKKSLFLLVFVVSPLLWGMISVEQAEQIIREFEGVPDMPLYYEGLSSEFAKSLDDMRALAAHSLPWPGYFFSTTYTTHTEYFKDPSQSLGRYYVVDPFTGQIVFWCDNTLDMLYPIGPESVEEDLQGELKDEVKYVPQPGQVSDMLTPQQAVNVAIDYVKKFYPAFNPSEYDIEISQMRKEGEGRVGGERPYDPSQPNWPPDQMFTFRISVYFDHKVVDGQGDTIKDCTTSFSVDITSTKGELICFMGYHYPINIPLVPTISREEAEQIAFNYIYNQAISFGYSPPSYMEVISGGKGVGGRSGAVPPDWLTYFWVFDVYVEIPNTILSPRDVAINVDAYTGEVGGTDWGYGILKEKIPTIKQLIYYKKALRAKRQTVRSWKIIWRGADGFEEKMIPFVKNDRFYIKDGQAIYFLIFVEDKGKEVILKNKNGQLKLKKGEFLREGKNLYIPLEAVLKIAGYETEYVKEKKEIRLKRK